MHVVQTNKKKQNRLSKKFLCRERIEQAKRDLVNNPIARITVCGWNKDLSLIDKGFDSVFIDELQDIVTQKEFKPDSLPPAPQYDWRAFDSAQKLSRGLGVSVVGEYIAKQIPDHWKIQLTTHLRSSHRIFSSFNRLLDDQSQMIPHHELPQDVGNPYRQDDPVQTLKFDSIISNSPAEVWMMVLQRIKDIVNDWDEVHLNDIAILLRTKNDATAAHSSLDELVRNQLNGKVVFVDDAKNIRNENSLVVDSVYRFKGLWRHTVLFVDFDDDHKEPGHHTAELVVARSRAQVQFHVFAKDPKYRPEQSAN